MRNSEFQLIRTRTTLIKRLQNWQDQTSWQVFFDIYWKLIFNFAVKSGLTATEAEDVVQETMFTVAKHMPSFKYDRNIGSFKSWLLSVARWRIADQFRKRDPVCRSTSISDADIKLANLPDAANLEPDAIWEVEWQEALIEAATTKVKRSVNPQHYQIFNLCMKKAWNPSKIAKAFGISVDQVYLRKHRVTEAIKEEVERLRKSIT
jgi:RNA polymerase sigma factor (sigma-70 family)